jgi:hypothetical protein
MLPASAAPINAMQCIIIIFTRQSKCFQKHSSSFAGTPALSLSLSHSLFHAPAPCPGLAHWQISKVRPPVPTPPTLVQARLTKDGIKVAHAMAGDVSAGTMSFKQGDTLIITEQQSSGWWIADLNGISGMVPSTCVSAADAG